MITLDEITRVLFSNETDKNALLNVVRSVEGFQSLNDFDEALEALFLQFDEKQLQLILAPFLRATAIKHVRESESSNFFRAQYCKVHGEKALARYLSAQNQNGTYGADEEAKALADLFNVALKITIVNPRYSYVAREADTRPIFHLFNETELHWYIYESDPDGTLGFGNCLYHSFAQILRHNVLEPLEAMTVSERQGYLADYTTAELDVINMFFNHMHIYQKQDELRAGFDKLPRHTNEQLADIVLNLSTGEKADHLHALDIAVNDEVTKKPLSGDTGEGSHTLPVKNLSTPEKADIDNVSNVDSVTSWPTDNLFSSIQDMKAFGGNLNCKGVVATRLAAKLEAMVTAFFKNKSNTREDFPEFKKNFSMVLNSENKEMSEYGTSWSTILKNIAIALTGIGMLAIAGKLIYSRATEGRAVFFFQNTKTDKEIKRDAVKVSLDEIESTMTVKGS